MAGKVVLTYFDGRGKMESIRWLLTAAEVETGLSSFNKFPWVEIDGIRLIQTKAILKYIAEKYNLHGKDIKGRAMINMYSEGLMDLMEMIRMLLFTLDCKSKLENIKTKAKDRYLPVFEKALAGSVYLVGGRMSMADVQLLECSLMLEEEFPGILNDFSNVKSFQARMTQVPTFAKFLQPGSKRKPPPDENFKKIGMEVLFLKLPLP